VVGEEDGILEAGGMIRLGLEPAPPGPSKVLAFRVHSGHAAKAGLRFSPRLLELAREVLK